MAFSLLKTFTEWAFPKSYFGIKEKPEITHSKKKISLPPGFILDCELRKEMP